MMQVLGLSESLWGGIQWEVECMRTPRWRLTVAAIAAQMGTRPEMAAERRAWPGR